MRSIYEQQGSGYSSPSSGLVDGEDAMQITLYMLRRDLDGESFGFKEGVQKFKKIPTHPLETLHNVQLRLHQSDPQPPAWLSGLLGIADFDHFRELLNRQTGALLSFDYREYRFILAYGTGWRAIDPTALEPNFGLKVVANAVSADNVRSADTYGVSGRRRNQRTTLASAGPLYELGIESADALVRQLEGTPASDFADAASGNDALKLRFKSFSLRNLDRKLDQIIERFEAEDYKKSYEFLDYFKRIHRNDAETHLALNEILADMLKEGEDNLDFTVPDILEPLSIDYFELAAPGVRSVNLWELNREAVYGALNSWQVKDPLRNVTVRAYGRSGEEVVTPHPLFYYIAADVWRNEGRYALSAGQWFALDASYLEAVQRRIAAIEHSDLLQRDPWMIGEDEGHYNERIARDHGWRLLDKKNFSFGGHQRIEICDVLTASREMICVKRMTKSSALSHLFAQGSVSGDLLISDPDHYQKAVVNALRDLRPNASFGDRGDWKIVFGIATEKDGPLSRFSKVPRVTAG
jgi:uncharacterized protein (TIGR04141 family)